MRRPQYARKPRRWPYYALIVFYGVVFFGVFVNGLDIQVWPFNPPPDTVQIPLNIVYPQSASTSGNPSDINSLTFNGILVIEAALQSTGPIVENQPVIMNAAGAVSPQYADKIDKIHVAMEDALLCGGSQCGGLGFSLSAPNFGVTLQKNITNLPEHQVPPVGNLANFTQMGMHTETIYWPVQGDYYPIITIFFTNGTQKDVPYSSQLVHVDSADVTEAQREGRINVAISFALVAFGFVEGLKIIQDTRRGSKGQGGGSSSGSSGSSATPTPTTAKPTSPMKANSNGLTIELSNKAQARDSTKPDEPRSISASEWP